MDSRLERAARALLEAVEAMRVPQTIVDAALQVATFSPLVSSLRAALAAPEPAQASAAACPEAIRSACSSVPALEEARRRRLRWADEAYKQILDVTVPAQPAQAGEAGDSDDGGNCRAHGAPVCEPCAFDRGYAAGLCKNAEAQPHPTPRAGAYVEWCARHANIEKVPGPFCPACAYASVMRDGVKMGRESAPRAQPAPEGAGEAVAASDMIEAIRLIGVALGQEDDWVDKMPAMVEFAAGQIRRLYAAPSRPGGA